MPMMLGSPETYCRCAFSATTRVHGRLTSRKRKARKMRNPDDAAERSKSEKKGEASQKGSPHPNEPVGGRLIRVLYCRRRGKSFHFILKGRYRRKSEGS